MSSTFSEGDTPVSPSHPPFVRLLSEDIPQLLTQALILAVFLSLLGLLDLARVWLLSAWTHMGDDILITAVVDDPARSEALREALASESRVLDLQEFGPDAAVKRLTAMGLDPAAVDPALLQAMPRGHTFRWERLARDPSAFRAFAQRLARDHGAEVFWDEARAMALHAAIVESDSRFARLAFWGSLLVTGGLVPLALLLGCPRSGLGLRRGEMAQALAVRGGAAAVVAWVFAGAVLALIARRAGIAGAEGSWLWTLWIIPAAGLVAPLAVLSPRRRATDAEQQTTGNDQ